MSVLSKTKTGLFLIPLSLLFIIISSCEPENPEAGWFDDEKLTIYQYLTVNQKEFSKFHSILHQGKLLTTLSAYNPYEKGYTLFLPTNAAIENFISQSDEYATFEELLMDTAHLFTLARYHTVNNEVNSDLFPFGAITDKTLSGDRITTGFFPDGDSMVIKVNSKSSVIKSDLKMTNGYVHVISEVLQQPETDGYDWLQQQEDYSILAGAMELCEIKYRLWMDRYTILAEHDSVYHRNGIFSVEELINRIATPELPLNDRSNSFYIFTAFHILNGEFFLNDLDWGREDYRTLTNERLIIDANFEVQINPGVDTFDVKISETGDTTLINYIRPVWENSNIITLTGPVHAITDILTANSLPRLNLPWN